MAPKNKMNCGWSLQLQSIGLLADYWANKLPSALDFMLVVNNMAMGE